MSETLPDAETLATEFAIVIREWLTAEQCSAIDALNRCDTDKNVCHSHDFCDANQAMIDAFGRFNIEFDVANEDHVSLCNRAWDIAKQSGFGYE